MLTNTQPKTRRPKRKWLLFALVVVLACGVLGATLRDRPKLEISSTPSSNYTARDLNACLVEVNQDIAHAISEAGLDTAPRASDLEICRRITLALVGSGMSLEEVRAVEQLPENDRVLLWTEHLLSDRRWADYFSERIARACVGTNNGPFLLFRRRKFNSWLADQLQAGVGYDRIVRAMIGADGLWTDTPEINFITATMDETRNGRADPVRLAGRTSRAFLAMRIDCLQCHDDVLQKMNFGSDDEPVAGTQHHFHQLAAFYGGTTLANPVFRGIVEDKRPYEFKYLNAESEELVSPQVPFQPELLPDSGKPRRRLAQWVTHAENKQFSRAAVNRVWALLFGTGLVNPVDEIPLVGPVPAALDTLAKDFAQHDFDLRRLVAIIVQTEAFQRSSQADFEITAEHESSWAVYPLSQLRPDQVASSIIQACRLTAVDDRASIFTQLKAFGDEQKFLQLFGDRGEDEFDSDAVTISQRLLMMNGNLVTDRTKQDLVANASTQIAALVGDNEKAIELTFLSVLNRYPTPAETKVFSEHLNGKYGNTRMRAIADMAWAMLNTTEFSWNH